MPPLFDATVSAMARAGFTLSGIEFDGERWIASGKPGEIIDFWHDDPRRKVVAPTLEDWVRSLVENMESGRLEFS